MIATADSHSVENIIEFDSQLSPDSFAQKGSLAKPQRFLAFKKDCASLNRMERLCPVSMLPETETCLC
jgi:hypothetical protein